MELAEITKGLNEILEKRKNKVKPNLETKMLYSKLWTELLKLQGFSRLAEEYFYKGFVYTGAGPLKEYLDSVKNKDILLNSIFKSRLFNQNVDSRFRIATGLLAEFINGITMLGISAIAVSNNVPLPDLPITKCAFVNNSSILLKNVETTASKLIFL